MEKGESTQKSQETRQTASEAWQEVGRQFQALGESLAAAFRASWPDPKARKQMETIQTSLEEKVKELDEAIQEAMRSPQAQQVKADAKKVAASLREASEQTILELRPHLLTALKRLSDEIQKMVNSMERGSQPESEAESSTKKE